MLYKTFYLFSSIRNVLRKTLKLIKVSCFVHIDKICYFHYYGHTEQIFSSNNLNLKEKKVLLVIHKCVVYKMLLHCRFI